jgi:TetR/AcrR family transcriptional regulator, transcriptional repressor for nem operon
LLFSGSSSRIYHEIVREQVMNESARAIMDAAERRMRMAGFNGFSFREIAADVGVKSSSVHYHFPTKESLAAAVIRRYTKDVEDIIERCFDAETDPVKVWTRAFRGTLHSEDRICPCAVLGAESQDIPPEVATEVKGFFEMCLSKLVKRGLSPARASEVLATITGAMVVANALDDISYYDRATNELMRQRKASKDRCRK